jgi:hypothetical protein
MMLHLIETVRAALLGRRPTVRVPLDEDVDAWLWRLSRLTGDPPGKMVAAMLRDIMVDDEVAHGERILPPPGVVLH